MSLRRSLPWALAVLAMLAVPALSSALTIRNARVQPSRFSPNADGLKDTAYVRFELSDPADFIYIRIYDGQGGLVATQGQSSGGGPFTGTQALAWGGVGSDGYVVPEGVYTIALGASLGGVPAKEVPLTASVDLTAPAILQVSVPGPITPTLAAGLVSSLIQFKVAGVQRTVPSSSPDSVLVWVEHIPGARAERDDTLEVHADSIRADTTWYSALWAPPDTLRNDGLHPVHIETIDEAGNTGGGAHWSVDVVLHGPTIRVLGPPDPARRPAIFALPFYPDSLKGTVQDRSGVREFIVQFASSPAETLTLRPGVADTLQWAVAIPDSLRKDNTFTVTISSSNLPGYLSRDARTYQLDTGAPATPVIASGIPRRVRREILTLSVTATGADSVIRILARSDGTVQQSTRKIITATYTDTLRFTPGSNFVSYQAKDLAGNLSAVVGDSVFYDVTDGLGAPQAFHAGDAFSARLSAAGESFDVRIYRPDGGFVRALHTTSVADNTGRNFEIAWDLKNDAGTPVGRGPYICILTATLTSGDVLRERKAVVALP